MQPKNKVLILQMEIIRKVETLRHVVSEALASGKSVGLVPTMGALHAGHISLVERARKENDIVVVSVFVNPTQFNNAEDLATYPRTEEADCAKLSEAGVDIAFIPSVEEMYPEPDTRQFDLGDVAAVMEGARRPVFSILYAPLGPILARKTFNRSPLSVVWSKLRDLILKLSSARSVGKQTDWQ